MQKRVLLPAVSVFITVYNRESFIRECVESVINQTGQDFEICICDDGSTDRTPEILNDLQKEYNKEREIIRVSTHKKNKGVAAAYRTAIGMGRGRYIAQLDSDDVLYPKALATLGAVLDTHPTIGLVCSDYEYVDSHGNFYAPSVYQAEISTDALKHLMLNKTAVIHHLRMFRRDLLDKIQNWCDTAHLCADYDLYIKLTEITNVMKVPEILYQQRWHEGNISHQRVHQQLSARLVQLRSARRRIKRIDEKIISPHSPALASSSAPPPSH